MPVDTSGVRPTIVAETEAELARRQSVVDVTYDRLESMGFPVRRQTYIELDRELTERLNQRMGERVDALA